MSENTSVVRHYSDTLTAHKVYTRMGIETDKAQSFSFDELVEKTKADIDRLLAEWGEQTTLYSGDGEWNGSGTEYKDEVIINLIRETDGLVVDKENIATINMQIALIDTLIEKAGWLV